MTEPDTFGTDEFVELCRRIGAEPYICFNGLAAPRENLDWVAYCNATEGKSAEMRKANGHPEPFNVKFWSVGNERYDKADQYTMAEALFAASFLNACLRHSDTVTMANIAPLVNTRGPIYSYTPRES